MKSTTTRCRWFSLVSRVISWSSVLRTSATITGPHVTLCAVLMDLFENLSQRYALCVLNYLAHAHQKKLNLKQTLEREARGCQVLVLWLDCDREGENIAFEVVQVCTAVNPRLRILRAHFSALIPR